jgi:hypothetical protein
MRFSILQHDRDREAERGYAREQQGQQPVVPRNWHDYS